MSKMKMLQGERVVLSSDNDVLVLTNKRVRYDFVSWGQSSLIGITLESVASCGLRTRSFPILLVLAVAAVFVAFTQRGELLVAPLFVATALGAAYFFSREAVISVASKGGREILVPTKGLSRKAVLEFIDAVEAEKLKQYGAA